MRKDKKPLFMTERRNTSGERRYYWQPSKTIKTFGFKIEPLGNDFAEAVKKANRMNEAVEEWKAGRNQPAFTKRSAPVVTGSFQALVNEYKQTVYWTERRKSTLIGYEKHLKKILRVFGDKPLCLIQRADISAFYNAQAVEHRSSANAALRVINILMNYAVTRDYIIRNPAQGIRIAGTPPRRSVWSKGAELAFLEACDELNRPSQRRAFILGLYTGQREGDILSLKWPNVMTTADGMTICLTQSKTGTYLEIPAARVVVEELKRDVNKGVCQIGRRSGALVKNEYTNAGYEGDAFRKVFGKIRARAQHNHPEIDFSNLQFIDLRRTCVVRMAERGATIPQITAVTGHKTDECQRIIETYLPRNRTMAAEAIRKLDAFC